MRNKAEQNLEASLIDRITSLERQLRELKSAVQPVGGDILKVVSTVGALVGPVTLASNSFVVLSISAVNTAAKPSLRTECISVYVDTLDHQHTWPSVADGTGVLTAAQQNFGVTVWADYEDTNFTTGATIFKIYILNRDTASHTVWLHARGFAPQQAGS